MLHRYRRWFAALSFLLLATPLVWGMVRPDSPELVFKEGRRLAPAPAAPKSLTDWLALPAQIDAFLKDRFGLRHAMIRLHKDLTHPVLFKANPLYPHRPRRTHVLSGRRDGASERGACSARPESGCDGRHARGDARRAGRARHRLSGDSAAQFVDHLPGRSSRVGAERWAERRNTISFSRIWPRTASRRSTCGR